VKLNRIEDRDVQTFVHKSVARANPPEWSCAHLICRTLARVLDNAIARADVVQSKVAKGVNDLVSKGCRNRERTTIDERSRSRSNEGSCVTNRAAY